MYHLIEFTGEFVVDLEISRRRPLGRLRIRNGSRMRARLKPYVVETWGGPVEVADLFFGDGTTARGVPLACFSL
jgi:hypothetical protein